MQYSVFFIIFTTYYCAFVCYAIPSGPHIISSVKNYVQYGNANPAAALGQPGLSINPTPYDRPNIRYYGATYNGVDAKIHCDDGSPTDMNLLFAYNTLYNAVKSGKYNAIGRPYVSIPLHRFSHMNRPCFVIENECTVSLKQYYAGKSIGAILNDLPQITIQILKGLVLMHQAGLTNNYIDQESICIKNAKSFSPTAFIRDFSSVKPLIYEGRNKVAPETLDGTTFLFESPEDGSGIMGDRRKVDTWLVGVVVCQTLVQEEIVWEYNPYDWPVETVLNEVKWPTDILSAGKVDNIRKLLKELMTRDVNTRHTPETLVGLYH
ncbi:hypothetical protein BDF22DRAFT_773054 [Syncephalis plumigaleata]|nr:hypothetical protein BDF22DRAFT_773054 [Syncephalis plumigaleata]